MKDINLNKYRLKRTNGQNITIQKQSKNGKWESVAYYGNNPKSLASGLMNVVAAEHTPNSSLALIEQVSRLIVYTEDSTEKIEGWLAEQFESLSGGE